jgi:mannitol/fructose-specific phosphotransferase system IIA component (Ntr-type)
MLQHVKRQLPRIDPDKLLDEMWKREEDYTSLLGNGIALPHAWSTDFDQTKLVIARPEVRVTCPLTNLPIEIVFMLLSPIGKANDHLDHLSVIARLIGTQEQRQRILQAHDPEELYELIAMC